MSKSVLFVAPGELDSVKNSYVGRWLSAVELLRSRGVEAHILTSSFIHPTKEFFYSSDPRFHVVECGGYFSNVGVGRVIYSFRFAFAATLWGLRNRERIRRVRVVFNSIPPENYFVALVYSLLGAVVYVDARDLWPEAIESSEKSKGLLASIWKKYAGWLTGKLLGKGVLVFYTSMLYSKRLDGLASIFVPLGIDLNRWVGVREPKVDVAPGCLKIGYIGSKSNQCDLSHAYLAVRGSKDVVLEVIGRYPDDEVGSSPWVVFHGYRSGFELKEIVSGWEAGLLADMSFSAAGLPNKLFDYIGANRPVIVMKRSDELCELDRFVLDNGIGALFYCGRDDLELWVVEFRRAYPSYRSNVERIRDRFSRDRLYGPMVEELARDG